MDALLKQASKHPPLNHLLFRCWLASLPPGREFFQPSAVVPGTESVCSPNSDFGGAADRKYGDRAKRPLAIS
jgi:hypothetical protein